MSRMAAMLGLVFSSSPVLAQQAPMDAYLEKTTAEPRCKAAVGDEIMVCGRREADKYRVPLIMPTPGDRRIVDVPAERARLVATESPCQTHGPYLVGCGAVGVSVSTKIGSGKAEYRPRAR